MPTKFLPITGTADIYELAWSPFNDDRAPGRALIGLRRWTKVRHSNRKILFIPALDSRMKRQSHDTAICKLFTLLVVTWGLVDVLSLSEPAKDFCQVLCRVPRSRWILQICDKGQC
jgi:hypothetical protein